MPFERRAINCNLYALTKITMKLDNEKVFPIWSFSVKWSESGIQDPEYPGWYKDLPEGRVWNSTSFRKMYKELPSTNQINKYFYNWWDKYKLKIPEISDVTITIEFIENEVWCLDWFSHYTFDIGQSDEDALNSFEDFILRKTILNNDNGHCHNEYNFSSKLPYYCLMGAEDRYRWHGKNEDESSETSAPCRCKFCKEQGIIRIDH